jgi:hypothetical protein
MSQNVPPMGAQFAAQKPAFSVKPLIAALADSDDSARNAAAKELVQIGGPAVEPLVECLRYGADHKGAGDMACWALGEIGDPRGIRSLIGALGSQEQGVRPAAAKALVLIGAPAVNLLIVALENPIGEIRNVAMTTLETIGDPRAAGPLMAARTKWAARNASAPNAPAEAAAPAPSAASPTPNTPAEVAAPAPSASPTASAPANPVAPAPALLDSSLESLTEFLSSQDLASAVEDAKRARDRASAEEWTRQGSPGAGLTHSCALCKAITYGEETVVEMQQQAVLVRHSPLEAQQIDQKSGYRCKNCGREYCKDCLEKKAPSNAYGGKSCPSCNGLFEIIHG